MRRRTITGWDLMVHAVEPPAYLGRDRELLAGPADGQPAFRARRHRRAGRVAPTPPLNSPYIPVLAAFDHEENGSQSDTGADGPLLGTVLERSVFARGGAYEDRARAFAGTVCLSSDTGHAVHPNYASATTRRTTRASMADRSSRSTSTCGTRRTAAAGRSSPRACERPGVPWQSFVSNNAMPCGTTIGPITAARHGIPTVDIGVAILSMHSARELCGADDPYLLANALIAFLED